MAAETWVVNASPIIALSRIGQPELLVRLAQEIWIPAAVISELLAGSPGDAARQLIESGFGQRVVAAVLPAPVLQCGLGRGESEVLAVALENPGTRAVLDDLAARTSAKTLGVPTIGTLGIVLRARMGGLLTSAAEVVRQLRDSGFHLDEATLRQALSTVGESWPP